MKIDEEQLEHLCQRYLYRDITPKTLEKMRKQCPGLFTTESKLAMISGRMGMEVTLK